MPRASRGARFFALALATITGIIAASIAAHAETPGLFGTREIHSTDLAPFTKWDRVVARTDAQMSVPQMPCHPGRHDMACAASWWRGFVAGLSRLPLRQRIARANAVLNRVPYVSAETNWHDPNHWETPYEFLTRGGQCEDYAIAKFMALAASGMEQSALRLVVVRDLVTGLDHAIAVAYVDGVAYVLDNQIKTIIPAADISRYVPYYSINRNGWWYHEPRSAQRLAAVQSDAAD